MVNFVWRLTAVYGSAMVLMFFSEFYFVNEGPVLTLLNASGWTALVSLAEMAIYYCLFAYIFLITIDRFSVKSIAGLLLAGTLFGWATEALIVPVVHEAPPVSWVFPSIGWHALIDVMLGWFLLRIAMRRLSWPVLSFVFVVTGVVWSIWATWYWTEIEPGALNPMSQAEFTKLAIYGGAAWIAGNVLADIGASRDFHASKWEIGLIMIFSALLFLSMALPYLPVSLGLIAPIALTFLALQLGRKSAVTQVDRLAPLSVRPPASAYLVSVLMPVSAIFGYRIVLGTGVSLPDDLIPPLLMLIGLFGFVWAIWRAGFAASQEKTRELE